ncbi:MAG TPA: hypothetical protein VKV25_01995, partial [Acidimicrobiales bacterium]|nr:hypothetical protein [Acidimicrobiales bacterium]
VGLLTYGSAWGNLKHPWFGRSDVWWDLGILAVFSLIIFYWAMAVALPSEEIQATIDAVVVPEETVLTQGA